MNLFALSGLLTGVAALGFGFFVFIASQNKKIGQIWFLFSLAVAGWGLFGAWGSSTHSIKVALWVWRMSVALGAMWIPILFYHFISVFLGLERRRSILIHYLIGTTFFLSASTPYFIHDVRWIFSSFYYFRPGLCFYPYTLWWFGLIFYSHYVMIRAFSSAPSTKKNQIKYFFLATAIGYSGGCFDFLPIFGVDLYPYGNLTVCLYPFFMSYAIVKHHLLDINIIIRKTVIYSLVSGILAAILVFVAMLSAHFTEGYLGYKTFYALAVAACLITAIFHPLQLKIQAFVDKHLFRDWSDRPMVREVASGFSHELKSPLAGLSMQAQLTMSDLEDFGKEHPPLRKELSKVEDGLRYILNQAMDAARRIEAVRGVAEPAAGQLEPVDIAGVLENSLSALGARLGQANVAVRQDLPKDLPPVQSNGKQLEIVFINLVKNALDAMDGFKTNDSHALSLTGLEQNGAILVSIKDTGPGIAVKDLNRIFEPYFTTKGHKGTGMGLYLAQQIIKAHGGTIEVKSEAGKGTEFIVRLPKYESSSSLSVTRVA